MIEDLLLKFWEGIIYYAPRILGAILVFIFGLYFSSWIGKKFKKYLEKTKLNFIFQKAKINREFSASYFLGEFLKWSLILFFLMACSEILGLSIVSESLMKVIAYLPNVFIAILIFIACALAVNFSSKVFIGSIREGKFVYSRALGKGLENAIWILGGLAILYQLKIVPTLILIIFAGFISLLVLFLGISFGLGGKDIAKKVLEEFIKRFR